MRNGTKTATIAASIGLGLALGACGKKGKDDDGGTAAADGGGAGGDSDGDDDGADGGAGTGAPMVVAGSISIAGLRLAEQSVSAVLAVSADGDRVEGTYDASTGAFSVPLAKDSDKNYVITLLDESQSGSDMIVATVSSDNLSTIGVSEAAADAMNLGELAMSAAASDGEIGAAKVADESAVTGALGMTADEATAFGQYDRAAAKVANLDVDGDGKVDAKGDYVLSTTFGFSSETDPNQAQNTLGKYKNTFLADDVVFNKGRFAITVHAKKSLFKTAPTNVVWTFSDAVDLDDSGTDITVDGVTKSSWKETIAAGKTIDRAYVASSNSPEDVYDFSLTVGSIPQGRYEIKAGGKTLVFTGVDVKGYNEAPPVVPFIKFNVDSSDQITGVDYKWMARKADGSGWEKATAKLVSLFVGKAGGHFSMYVLDGDGQKTDQRLQWKMAPDSLEGSIAFSKDAGCVMNGDPAGPDACPMGDGDHRLYVDGFDSIDAAKKAKFATWGWNNFTFTDKLEMMVSVN
jgi:hypothetical protein